MPELIFGELLTGSSFDDEEEKVTGGRNGLGRMKLFGSSPTGAKLANIFSTEFIVETASSEYGKKFNQVFKNNMTSRSTPKITNSTTDYTRITFCPDLVQLFHSLPHL